jgi:uroporphyrinogen decarboxylase
MGGMTHRDRIRAIIARRGSDRTGIWLGNPHETALPALHGYFGTSTLEELHAKLGSDLRWLTPQYLQSTYRHPEGKGLFDVWKTKASLGDAGPLAAAEDPAEVDAYAWPDPAYLHVDEGAALLRSAGDSYRASGFWMPFFHDVMDLFGMEEMLLKMYTHPDVIHAAFARVCGFYLEANARFYAAAGGEIDGFFFGNDFGTQRDLLLSPDQFEEFLLPWIRQFAAQAKRNGCQVLLHSCGSIGRIIPSLIEAGIECLHPLQARAFDMDAETLASRFGGKIAFLGGIDTQELLVRGTPGEIREEVRRIRRVLGPHLIVSPSHESLLSNVPPENVAAMAEAALA